MSARRSLAALLLGAWASAASALPALDPPRLAGATLEPLAGVAPATAIRDAGREPVWIGWSIVPVVGAERVCCGWSEGRVRACSLADDDHGWSSTGDEGTPERLYVLAEAASGRVRRLKQFSPDCVVDGAGRRVLWLGGVAAGASLDALEPLLTHRDEDEVGDRALATIAFHADPRADRILERRALDRTLDDEAREHALFWAGNLRGEAGYRLLDRVLATDEEEELRRHALFALTVNSDPRAIERLKRAAVEDRDADVRAQGLFWLAQSDTPGAGDWILARMRTESDEHVRDQAVFALSQLDDGADRLLALLRSTRDPQLVRQALFWLGQSDDPRALAELERILAR